MNEAEKAFLAFLSIGIFTVDPAAARILKHRRLIAGSHSGTPPYWRDIPAQIAARSMSDGYPTIMFSDGKVRHKVFIHRIVWMLANQSDIPPGMQVNHIDGNRSNAIASNLELVTPSQNTIHSIRVLGNKPKARYGSANSVSHLTEKDIPTIRALCGQMTQKKIAERYGVTQGTISAILLRKTWAHVA